MTRDAAPTGFALQLIQSKQTSQRSRFSWVAYIVVARFSEEKKKVILTLSLDSEIDMDATSIKIFRIQ